MNKINKINKKLKKLEKKAARAQKTLNLLEKVNSTKISVYFANVAHNFIFSLIIIIPFYIITHTLLLNAILGLLVCLLTNIMLFALLRYKEYTFTNIIKDICKKSEKTAYEKINSLIFEKTEMLDAMRDLSDETLNRYTEVEEENKATYDETHSDETNLIKKSISNTNKETDDSRQTNEDIDELKDESGTTI